MSDVYSSRCGKRVLQDALTQEFPAYSYVGPVLAVSHDPSVYEFDSDNLDYLLSGRTWRDLEPQFVQTNHDEYVLMNERSLPAFLGAWLWNAAENLHFENQIVDSLVFHLAMFGGSEQHGTGLWGGAFKGLNQSQRDVLELVLRCVAEIASNPQQADLVGQALRSVRANPCPC